MSEDVRDPQLIIRAQYIKDQSFENPNAPEVFSMIKEKTPKIDINVDVSPKSVGERTFEVTLTLRADAQVDESPAFVAELEYAGLVSLADGLSDEQVQHALLVETPRHLFPFARAIMANVTRDGGFPPLVVNPIDFRQMLEKQAGADGPPQAAEA
jgi:preprotein translocase subunit SecB